MKSHATGGKAGGGGAGAAVLPLRAMLAGNVGRHSTQAARSLGHFSVKPVLPQSNALLCRR